MYDTLLVPTDGSEHAERAAEHALSLSRAFDATVHFLAVVDVDAEAGLDAETAVVKGVPDGGCSTTPKRTTSTCSPWGPTAIAVSTVTSSAVPPRRSSEPRRSGAVGTCARRRRRRRVTPFDVPTALRTREEYTNSHRPGLIRPRLPVVGQFA